MDSQYNNNMIIKIKLKKCKSSTFLAMLAYDASLAALPN
jgi:hypothetical protein